MNKKSSLKEDLKRLSDDELDKVAGGTMPCLDARCIYKDNHCVCPDDDDE